MIGDKNNSGKMNVNKMTVDKMITNEMTVYRHFVAAHKLTVNKLNVDEMTPLLLNEQAGKLFTTTAQGRSTVTSTTTKRNC